ncbi:MAG: transcription antitermination factor NusB [Eubacteriales bacterium]|nr:transcription antitermination factor NusB [Eubacteriales bacterium]
MSRREARESAMKVLYSQEIDQSANLEQAKELFLANYPLPEEDLLFFDQLIAGVLEHRKDLDLAVAPRLSGWTIDRLPKVDLTILRIALYELIFTEYVPNNVAIAEAVRLAKTYSDDAARQYINAVLGNLNRELDELSTKQPELSAKNLLNELEQDPKS